VSFRTIFFDINIVLDILNNTRENHKHANNLVRYCILNNLKIVISEDMISTIFYINRDKQKSIDFFNVIKDDWTISIFGAKVIKNAIELSLENNLDLEDILQCLCAKENGCSVFITNDKKFYNCGIKIMSAENFLN